MAVSLKMFSWVIHVWDAAAGGFLPYGTFSETSVWYDCRKSELLILKLSKNVPHGRKPPAAASHTWPNMLLNYGST